MDEKNALGPIFLDTTFRRRWFSLNVRKWFEKSLFLKSVFFFQFFRRTCWMQIWIPRSKFFNNWAETIYPISENNGDKNSQKKHPLKSFLWSPTENAILKSTLEIFLTTDNTPEFFPLLTKNEVTKRFVKKKFPSTLLWDFVGERSIDFPGEIFLPRSRFFATRSPKTNTRYFLIKKTISSKCSSGQTECSFRIAPKSTCEPGGKKLTQGPKSIEKSKKFLKKKHSLKTLLWTPPEEGVSTTPVNFLAEGRKLSTQFMKMKIKRIFSSYKFSLKILLWTGRMQFWLPRRKIFAKKPAIFRWMSEKIRKKIDCE